MSDEKKVFIQVQAGAAERVKLSDIAKYQGVSMSDVVRSWIKHSHKTLPSEAKT